MATGSLLADTLEDCLDIASYDSSEDAARTSADSWSLETHFTPVMFNRVGFPVRLKRFGQVRGLMAGMHSLDRVQFFLTELAGLRDDDLQCLSAAVRTYVAWYRAVLPDAATPIPLGDLIAQYVAYTKLRGVSSRVRVLEIGSGYGLMNLFVRDDPQILRYDLIEITQSLYVVQASIAAFCYGEGFRNVAMEVNSGTRVGRLPAPNASVTRHRPLSLSLERRFRASLFPWWRLDEPLAGQYDVIMSHSNLAEMSPQALDYYLDRWGLALADSGCLIVQDLGHPDGRSYESIFEVLAAKGYRALAKSNGHSDGKYFFMWNLLLIGPRHPDYERAMSPAGPPGVLADNSLVRAVYGLDRTEVPSLSVRELGTQVASWLQQFIRSA